MGEVAAWKWGRSKGREESCPTLSTPAAVSLQSARCGGSATASPTHKEVIGLLCKVTI